VPMLWAPKPFGLIASRAQKKNHHDGTHHIWGGIGRGLPGRNCIRTTARAWLKLVVKFYCLAIL
jgi:hypothetical protein